jgi:hypothetical protein
MWAGMLPYKVLTGWERIAGLISNEYYWIGKTYNEKEHKKNYCGPCAISLERG